MIIYYSPDSITRDKSQGYLFRSVLKCIPYLIEEVGRSDKIAEIIPQHGISIDPGVREEAVQVLNRIVKHLPHRRFAVLRGIANFILRLPDEFHLLIQTSLGVYWNSCEYEEYVYPMRNYNMMVIFLESVFIEARVLYFNLEKSLNFDHQR